MERRLGRRLDSTLEEMMYCLRTILVDESVLQTRKYAVDQWNSLVAGRDTYPSLSQIWLYRGEDEKVLVWQREYE